MGVVGLSKRERQIMDIVYANGLATASEVREAMDDPPSYSAVRALMKILVDKGHLRYKLKGKSYVYSPTVTRAKARKRALSDLLQTFFAGSVESAMATLIGMSKKDLTDDDLDRLAQMIEEAKEKEE